MEINKRVEENQHNYGIDLLRIIAMLMIVAHHFALHSGIVCDDSISDVFKSVMALGGKTGVNIFVLITGVYAGGKVKREKIFKLIGCTTIYSVLLTGMAVVLGCSSLSKKLLIKACLPWLFGNNYWFIVTYLELYILAPLMNKVIQSLDERTYKNYLVLFACLLYLLPAVIGRFIETNDFGYNSLIWFVYLYFLGAYLGKYEFLTKFGQYIYIYIYI